MACARRGHGCRRARSAPRAARRSKWCGSPATARRKIHELSGGQQQRVALARALVNKPAVLLLDEPLAALDKKLRTDMQIELQNLQREIGITFVLVTHDQEEALSMSDFVCVMNGGRIVQLGQPSEIYDEPADLFVADFVGKTNLLSGKVAGHLRRRRRGGARGRHRDRGAQRTAVAARRGRFGQPAARSAPPRRTGSGAFKGIVRNRIFLGSTAEYAIEVPGHRTLLAKADHADRPGQSLQAGRTRRHRLCRRDAAGVSGNQEQRDQPEGKQTCRNHIVTDCR